MICNILNNLLSLTFCDSRKCEPLTTGAIIGSALIGGIGNIISGLFGSNASDSANAANAAMSRENRLWQSEENEKSRLWMDSQWQKQFDVTSAYNNPANQRRLLEQAGYNPYLLGDSNFGSSASSPSVSSPSMSSSPSLPNLIPSNPLSGLGSASDTFSKFVSLIPQMEQTESNKALQFAEVQQTISNMLYNAYEKGGQKLYDSERKRLAPYIDSFQWSGSRFEGVLDAQLLRLNIENDYKDIERSIYSLYGKDQAKAVLDNTKKSYDLMSEQINALMSQESLNDGYLRRVASEIAQNLANSFKLSKEGDYFVGSAQQIGIINQMLGMQLQDMEADFAFNTSVRKFKKEIPHRGIALGLFQGQLGAQSTNLELESNKFLRYGKVVTSMIGDMFKVNFGASVNRTNFNNLNPQSPSKMFYSGDGYYMNNGVLMKQNW